MNMTAANRALFVSLAAALALSWNPQTVNAQQFAEAASDEAPAEDETSWSMAAGGVFNSGNTQSWQVNAGTDFRLVRGRHALGANFSFNYGRANLKDENNEFTGYEQTVQNANTAARYDFFLTDNDAIFLAAKHRWDTFAGLDTRLQLQAGYLRNFFKEESHRFWGEIGYDFTYDNLHPDPLVNPDADPAICGDMGSDPMADSCFADGTAVVHAARVYVGYDNHLNDNVQFLAGAEVLINVQELEDVRLNFDAALRSTIIDSLQIELKFRLQFDNVPVPGAVKVDTNTTVSLIYTLI